MVYVHPFAEEMNKSRRMAALQARALAANGWDVLQIDLRGCGDSEDEFAHADWPSWVADVEHALAWLHAQSGHAPALWALRQGALIASEVAAGMEPAPDLLLWQPVLDGRQALQQFLRLRAARELMADNGAERSGTRSLREQLAREGALEIGGYVVSDPLARALEGASLRQPPAGARVAWLEVAAEGASGVSPAARSRIEAWRGEGCAVRSEAVGGPAFWQTAETAECPALIDCTLAAVAEWIG